MHAVGKLYFKVTHENSQLKTALRDLLDSLEEGYTFDIKIAKDRAEKLLLKLEQEN